VAYLKAELKEARSEAEAFKAQLAHAEHERQQLASVEDALAPIAREAIQRLQVALRQTPMTLVGLPASVLAAQYNEVKQQFEKVMPVGVHALSASEASREPVDIGEQRLFLVK
jgi:DNA repair exonuclease SbcCD ATPase subunit